MTSACTNLKPSAITHPQPAARALVQNEAGEVLMVYCANADFWDLPGGRLDFKEKAMEAAVRELHEETGVNAEIDRFAFSYEVYVDRLDWHVVHFVFQMKTVSDIELDDKWVDPDLHDISGGVTKSRFFSIQELKEMKNMFPSCLIDYLEQGRQPFFKSYMDKRGF